MTDELRERKYAQIPELEVRNLCKYFPAGKGRVLKAVDDVSFVIRKGQTLGIVGESGCGKTTCGKTCIGMLMKNSGEVLFQGQDVHGMSKKERFAFTSKVQMIFQDPYASLDPHQKVYNIIAEGIKVHKLAKDRKDEEGQVMRLLEMVGLNTEHANRNVHEFSGGQRQRHRPGPVLGAQDDCLRRAGVRAGCVHSGTDY